MRRTFNLSDIAGKAFFLHVEFDDNCDVYLNGDLVFSRVECRSGSILIDNSKLVIGQNVIAVCCSNLGGEGCLDFGLSAGIMSNDIGYKLDLDGARVMGYVGTSPNISIPETITYEGSTYDVTRIGSGAFCQRQDIENVVIPNTVTDIEDMAFEDCNYEA